jgi:hypothetical protein
MIQLYLNATLEGNPIIEWRARNLYKMGNEKFKRLGKMYWVASEKQKFDMCKLGIQAREIHQESLKEGYIIQSYELVQIEKWKNHKLKANTLSARERYYSNTIKIYRPVKRVERIIPISIDGFKSYEIVPFTKDVNSFLSIKNSVHSLSLKEEW